MFELYITYEGRGYVVSMEEKRGNAAEKYDVCVFKGSEEECYQFWQKMP